MAAPKYHDAQFYVQIEPVWSHYTSSSTGERALQGIKAVAITQKKPDRPRPGTVTANLTVRVPETAFLPLRPQVVIVIPEDMIAANLPIEVEAQPPES
jgi:hypothetical protein